MVPSYGETSGFSSVSNEELENVNGGSVFIPIITAAGISVLGIAAAAIVITATVAKKSK
jgi:hypothetical protein